MRNGVRYRWLYILALISLKLKAFEIILKIKINSKRATVEKVAFFSCGKKLFKSKNPDATKKLKSVNFVFIFSITCFLISN